MNRFDIKTMSTSKKNTIIVKTPKTKQIPALLSSGKILSTAEVMGLLGYTDSTSFWQTAKRSGLPFVRVSAKRAVFREQDLENWMRSRTVGAPSRQEAAP